MTIPLKPANPRNPPGWLLSPLFTSFQAGKDSQQALFQVTLYRYRLFLSRILTDSNGLYF
jgi:hypothetical protein